MHRRRLDNVQAPAKQSLGVFTSVIVIVCVGALVVTIQAKVGNEPVFLSFQHLSQQSLYRISFSVDGCKFLCTSRSTPCVL